MITDVPRWRGPWRTARPGVACWGSLYVASPAPAVAVAGLAGLGKAPHLVVVGGVSDAVGRPDEVVDVTGFLIHIGTIEGEPLRPHCSQFTHRFGDQVLVFHFPGVIHRVIGSVPYQVPERPRSRHLALGMVGANGGAIGGAMRLPSIVGQHRALRQTHPDLSPTPARRQTYDGQYDPDPALPRAAPSGAPPTRANARRQKRPSTPASAPIHVPRRRSPWLAGRSSKTRTRRPRSRLSPCPDTARPRRWR
jgi:hypothetical protein